MANLIDRIRAAYQGFSSPLYSIGDPAFAGVVAMGMTAMSEVSELIALRQPAFWRAVNLIAGTVATLPLETYRLDEDGEKQQVKSFIDNPAGPYPIPRYSWVEMVMAHLLTHGEVGLVHVYNNAGAIIGLWPVHPANFMVRWTGNEKEYQLTVGGGQQQTLTGDQFTHIMGLTLDGTRGISPLQQFRKIIQLAEAQDLAANRQMVSGMLVGGLVTPTEDLPSDEAAEIQKALDARLSGAENAGAMRLVNRKLQFTPWTANNVDMQFIQGREFSITEVARIFGIPPHLLGQVDKSTSWGSGIQEQNRNFAQFTLMPWTTRIEESLSTLLPSNRFCEFDYKGLLQGTPSEMVNSLLAQTGKPFLTVNEARHIMNLDPVPGGDELAPAAAPPSPEAAPSQDVQQKNSKQPDIHVHIVPDRKRNDGKN